MCGYEKYFGVKEGSRGGTVEIFSSITELKQFKANAEEIRKLRGEVLPELITAIKEHPNCAELVNEWNRRTKEINTGFKQRS